MSNSDSWKSVISFDATIDSSNGSPSQLVGTVVPDTNDPSVHWKGMPEFVQEKQEAYAKIIVRVDNEEDLQALAEALGQKLTKKTKSVWFPFRSHWGDHINEWVSEDSADA